MPKYPEFKSKPIIGLKEEDWGKLTTGWFNRSINTDWEASVIKRLANENYQTKSTKIDYKAFQQKRLSNVDNKIRNSKIAITKSKPVLQYDKQGNFIAEFNSAKEATIAMGKPGKDDIGNVCRGKNKTAYGFIWKFKENENNI